MRQHWTGKLFWGTPDDHFTLTNSETCWAPICRPQTPRRIQNIWSGILRRWRMHLRTFCFSIFRLHCIVALYCKIPGALKASTKGRWKTILLYLDQGLGLALVAGIASLEGLLYIPLPFVLGFREKIGELITLHYHWWIFLYLLSRHLVVVWGCPKPAVRSFLSVTKTVVELSFCTVTCCSIHRNFLW